MSEVLTKSEPNDAEFVQNLNKEFKKDRGFEIKLNMNSAGNILYHMICKIRIAIQSVIITL